MTSCVVGSRAVCRALGLAVSGPSIPSAVPWALAAAALVVAVLREQIKELIKWAVRGIAKRFYDKFAGSPLLRRAALRKYTTAVFRKYEFFVVPFVDNLRLPMRDVYVPLAAELSGPSDGTSRDAYAELRAAGRSVVIGVPGAGKSMLLRQTMFAWADKRCTVVERTRRLPWNKSEHGEPGSGEQRRLRVRVSRLDEVPVLVELHRMNGADTDLVKEIVAQFKRDGFPNADRFIEAALGTGRLTILLDGLDEVSSVRRSAVARQILDFADEHDRCRLVVTCREAVYQRQLAEQVTTTMRVADFDERLIRQFLYGWPRMRHDGMLEQLMSALRETPQLMQLARNPLLLTMIAYLYTSTATRADRTLPHTRAEFYKQVIDDLLEQRWHQAQNSFQGPKKKAVLLRLALLAHDQYGGSRDRIALPDTEVIREIRAKLPDLNYEGSQAEDLLDEIVSRSGLLLRIDGGERYQFAHQTLQEYLAAIALHSDAEGLLQRHEKDPHLWREVVRLWCGSVSQDSGDMISKIFERDPLLAFECLADAQNVSSGLADRIIGHFQDRLDSNPQVVAAFGLVASDRRPRGRRVFDFLTDTLRAHEGSRRGIAAAEALAATHLPDAVTALLPLAATVPAIESCLVSMGDIAVPVVAAARFSGDGSAARVLGRIGSPMAMVALVGFLASDSNESVVAARFLAAGLRDEQIDVALAATPLPEALRSSAQLPWVWSAFNRRPDDPLAVIAGRVAWILDQADSWRNTETPAEAGSIDPRIGIPLCTVRLRGDWARPGRVNVSDEMMRGLESMRASESHSTALAVGPRPARPGSGKASFDYLASLQWDVVRADSHGGSQESEAEIRYLLARRILEAADAPGHRIAMLDCLARPVQLRLVSRIFSADFTRMRAHDWEEVLRIPQ